MEKQNKNFIEETLESVSDQKLEATLSFYEHSIIYTKYDGKAISKIEVSGAEIEQVFAGVSFNSGLLDLNTLFYAKTGKTEEICLYFPAEKKRITLRFKGKNKVITIPVPAHVFHGIGLTYKIFAIKDLQEGSLCYMPLPNIHPNGTICHGSVSFPSCSKEEIKQAYKLFWESAFNKDLSDGKLSEKIDLHEFLISLDGKEQFPKGILVDSEDNLQDLVNSKDF
jgi:hypothetical protein